MRRRRDQGGDQGRAAKAAHDVLCLPWIHGPPIRRGRRRGTGASLGRASRAWFQKCREEAGAAHLRSPRPDFAAFSASALRSPFSGAARSPMRSASARRKAGSQRPSEAALVLQCCCAAGELTGSVARIPGADRGRRRARGARGLRRCWCRSAGDVGDADVARRLVAWARGGQCPRAARGSALAAGGRRAGAHHTIVQGRSGLPGKSSPSEWAVKDSNLQPWD